MTEHEWDKLLKIKTSGRDDSRSDQYRYPYEPTPYCVLEELARSEYFSKGNKVLDYGCGKGRVGFFLSYQCKCRYIGIEYDERIYTAAVDNAETCLSKGRVSFENVKAEDYNVPGDIDRCYFFNPFSVELLNTVLSKIKESYYSDPRELLLFFYFPSDEYVAKLMTDDSLMFVDEIDVSHLFEGNEDRERIIVFELA